MSELRSAVNYIKPRGEPGQDNIPPSFVKNLGPLVLDMLLHIFNIELDKSEVPPNLDECHDLGLLQSVR